MRAGWTETQPGERWERSEHGRTAELWRDVDADGEGYVYRVTGGRCSSKYSDLDDAIEDAEYDLQPPIDDAEILP